MALNVKPMYPFDHPEVTTPVPEIEKVKKTWVENRFDPTAENKDPELCEEKFIEINLKKKLDIIS